MSNLQNEKHRTNMTDVKLILYIFQNIQREEDLKLI